MSSFISVNLNHHKTEHDTSEFIHHSQLQCVCCLKNDTKWVRLSQCSHFNVLQDLVKFKMECENSYICFLCHGILINISYFQKQVEACYLRLTDMNVKQHDVNPHARLNLHTLDPIIINNVNATINIVNDDYKDPLDDIVKGETRIDWEHYAKINRDNRTFSEEVAEKDPKNIQLKVEHGGQWDDNDVKDESNQYENSPYNSDMNVAEILNEQSLVHNDKGDTVKKSKEVKKKNQKNKRKQSKQKKPSKNNTLDENKEEASCPICHAVVSRGEAYTTHYQQHLSSESNKIDKRRNDKKLAKSKKLYKCNVCGKISSTKDAHRYHRDTHRSRVECAQCDKTFSHRAAMINHTQGVHKMSVGFKCADCDKVFKWKTSLKKHTEIHERKGAPVPVAACEPCGVTFTSVCSYRRHLRSSLRHTTKDQLKFICDECGRRYVNKTKLRDHIAEKHLHLTYRCHICLKPSKNRVCLDQHIRNLHRGRPNDKICHHCGKGFPTNIQLESHIRSHTGERPYICQYCPSTFSHQSNLYKHNRQVHLNIKTKRCAASRKPKEPEPATAGQQMAPPVDNTMFDGKTITVPLLGFTEEKNFIM